MNNLSLEKCILEHVKKYSYRVFVAIDFAQYGKMTSINKALSRLHSSLKIQSLGSGGVIKSN